MKVLVHICCAICWARTRAGLSNHVPQAELLGYWYNPNIHPLLEYRRRLKALKVFGERDSTPVVIEDIYGLESFCRAIGSDYAAPGRCRHCYEIRLQQAARRAVENGCTAFTTTMITSSHQDHALFREIGEAAGAQAGVAFLYTDLRQTEIPESQTRGIYHQQYCGCVFSEEERFRNTAKHLYLGDAPL